VAVNCWVWLLVRETVLGETVTVMAAGGFKVMVAFPVDVLSKVLVAVTVTVSELEIVEGAV